MESSAISSSARHAVGDDGDDENTAPPTKYEAVSTEKHKVSKGRYLTSNDPRGYVPVWEYPLGSHWIMMDIDDGYVLWTAIWKALGNTKADVVKMLDTMPEIAPHIRRIRGGFLRIQGTWIKHEIARDLARRVSYTIREDLIPIFGPSFPDSCLTPNQPGYNQLVDNPNTPKRGRKRRAAPEPSLVPRSSQRLTSAQSRSQPVEPLESLSHTDISRSFNPYGQLQLEGQRLQYTSDGRVNFPGPPSQGYSQNIQRMDPTHVEDHRSEPFSRSQSFSYLPEMALFSQGPLRDQKPMLANSHPPAQYRNPSFNEMPPASDLRAYPHYSNYPQSSHQDSSNPYHQSTHAFPPEFPPRGLDSAPNRTQLRSNHRYNPYLAAGHSGGASASNDIIQNDEARFGDGHHYSNSHTQPHVQSRSNLTSESYMSASLNSHSTHSQHQQQQPPATQQRTFPSLNPSFALQHRQLPDSQSSIFPQLHSSTVRPDTQSHHLQSRHYSSSGKDTFVPSQPGSNYLHHHSSDILNPLSVVPSNNSPLNSNFAQHTVPSSSSVHSFASHPSTHSSSLPPRGPDMGVTHDARHTPPDGLTYSNYQTPHDLSSHIAISIRSRELGGVPEDASNRVMLDSALQPEDSRPSTGNTIASYGTGRTVDSQNVDSPPTAPASRGG